MKKITSILAVFAGAALTLSACTSPTTVTVTSTVASTNPLTAPPSAATSTSGLSIPPGTYSGAGLGFRNITATFSGQTLEIYSDFTNYTVKEYYTYSIGNDGTSITLTNLETKQVSTYNFKYIKEIGMDAIALTDHGSMYGSIDFYKSAKNYGII
jgi:hypothetical protein